MLPKSGHALLILTLIELDLAYTESSRPRKDGNWIVQQYSSLVNEMAEGDFLYIYSE